MYSIYVSENTDQDTSTEQWPINVRKRIFEAIVSLWRSGLVRDLRFVTKKVEVIKLVTKY